MKKRAYQFVFLAGAVLLVYVSLGLLLAIKDLAGCFRSRRDLWFGLAGFGLGAYVFTFLDRFDSVYVLGHEVTHFIFAKCFWKNTGRIEVTPTGGSVEVTDSNFVIVLAPYVFPFHFLLFAGLYCVLLLAWSSPPVWVGRAGAAWLGVCYAYHVVMTAVVLRKGQADLKFRGFLFSICFIVAGNLFFFYLGEMFLSGGFAGGFRLLGERIRWVLVHLGWEPVRGYGLELARWVHHRM